MSRSYQLLLDERFVPVMDEAKTTLSLHHRLYAQNFKRHELLANPADFQGIAGFNWQGPRTKIELKSNLLSKRWYFWPGIESQSVQATVLFSLSNQGGDIKAVLREQLSRWLSSTVPNQAFLGELELVETARRGSRGWIFQQEPSLTLALSVPILTKSGSGESICVGSISACMTFQENRVTLSHCHYQSRSTHQVAVSMERSLSLQQVEMGWVDCLKHWLNRCFGINPSRVLWDENNQLFDEAELFLSDDSSADMSW